jgi:hypothetical protein
MTKLAKLLNENFDALERGFYRILDVFCVLAAGFILVLIYGWVTGELP